MDTSYQLAGCPLQISTNSSIITELFDELYSRGPAADDGPQFEAWRRRTPWGSRFSIARRNGSPEQTYRGRDLADALMWLEALICQEVLERLRPSLVLHGATLTRPDRRDAVFVTGPSGAGKSTLALADTRERLIPEGDDAALLDPSSSLVEAIPRCFHLDAVSKQLLQQAGVELPQSAASNNFVTPRHFGAPHRSPCRVSTIVLLEPGSASGNLQRATQAETIGWLMQGAGFRGIAGCDALAAIRRMVSKAECFRLGRTDLAASARWLAATLQRSAGS